MKYIDSERLKAEINKRMGEYDVQQLTSEHPNYEQGAQDALYNLKLQLTSLQQDETQVDKMLCSQVWWEEQGWIMIPPDATIEGIDSLLKQVRKKLQQESTPNTNVLNTKLVNLLKTYRIGEETARTIADRIADTYGTQRYIDGLCDGLNEEDAKQE